MLKTSNLEESISARRLETGFPSASHFFLRSIRMSNTPHKRVCERYVCTINSPNGASDFKYTHHSSGISVKSGRCAVPSMNFAMLAVVGRLARQRGPETSAATTVASHREPSCMSILFDVTGVIST